MAPDGGLALLIGLVACVLPGASIASLGFAALALAWKRRWRLALVPVGLAGLVALVWFCAFGIEYVPARARYVVVVPDGYAGAAALVVCPDAGAPPDGRRVRLGANGIARVRDPEPVHAMSFAVRAERPSGRPIAAHATGSQGGGDDPCSWHELWIGPPGPHPPVHTLGIPAMVALAEREGVSYAAAVARHALR